ncbi:MAG: alpha/beta fold hydrolase [Desulfobacteraceae bacterium]|nr:MAG: alpha/beta fold hydrolase [Desulfobacteraceae bacterium]
MNDTVAFDPPHSGESPTAAVARIESLSEKRMSPFDSGHMVWHTWDKGKGTPVVLLHGGFGSWLHWIRAVPFLAARFSVFAATMPGFGESDDVPESHTLEDLASAVSAGIDYILPQGQPFHIIGFSFGGMVGGLVAALQGERLLSHTFSGSGGMGLTRNSLEPLRNWRKAETKEERMAAHRRNLEILMFADPEKVDDLAVYIQNWNTQRGRVRTYKYRHLDILREPLQRVKGRLMGLYGSHDAIIRGHLQERIRYLGAIQPDSVIREVAGAGHWACYEAAEDFIKNYLEMLET